LPFACGTPFEADASEDISQIRRYCSRRGIVDDLTQRDPEALLHRIKRGAMDRLRVGRGLDQDAARTLLRGDPEEALAEPRMESVVEALKAVGGGRSGSGSRQPDLDRQVEDQSEIRGKSAEGEA